MKDFKANDKLICVKEMRGYAIYLNEIYTVDDVSSENMTSCYVHRGREVVHLVLNGDHEPCTCYPTEYFELYEEANMKSKEDFEESANKIWEDIEWVSEGVSHENSSGAYHPAFENMYTLLNEVLSAYEEVEEKSRLLDELEAAGVDNWEGYSIALNSVRDE